MSLNYVNSNIRNVQDISVSMNWVDLRVKVKKTHYYTQRDGCI